MSIIAKEPENTFQLAPQGTHQAVCYAVWDIGLQKSNYNGEEKQRHIIIVAWEIKETFKNKEGEDIRFSITQRYTKSLDKKSKLREHLESWRGRAFTNEELKGFDIEKLVGINCLLNLIHTESNGKNYVNVKAVMSLTSGTEKMVSGNSPNEPEWIIKLKTKNDPVEILKNQFEGEFIEPDGITKGDVPF